MCGILKIFLVKNILHWGRPEAAEGGEVGRGALGKVRERGGGGGGEGGNRSGRWRAEPLLLILLFYYLKNLKNICCIIL